MKTPDEIKKGLECCAHCLTDCGPGCPYGNAQRGCNPLLLKRDALQLIIELEAKDVKQSQRIAELEASYSQVSKALCGKENATLDELLQAVEQVKQTKPGEKLICQITIPTADALLKAIEEVELDGKTIAEWLELVKGYKQLEADLAAAKRERDALSKDLKAACKLLWSDDSMQCCKFCEHENDPKDTGYCDKCANGNRFKFKPAALCPENTEVQRDG